MHVPCVAPIGRLQSIAPQQSTLSMQGSPLRRHTQLPPWQRLNPQHSEPVVQLTVGAVVVSGARRQHVRLPEGCGLQR